MPSGWVEGAGGLWGGLEQFEVSCVFGFVDIFFAKMIWDTEAGWNEVVCRPRVFETAEEAHRPFIVEFVFFRVLLGFELLECQITFRRTLCRTCRGRSLLSYHHVILGFTLAFSSSS